MRESLVRSRETGSQVGQDRVARWANVAGAFQARERLDGCSVVLIDDVITTGATLVECARACTLAGSRAVFALTLATAER